MKTQMKFTTKKKKTSIGMKGKQATTGHTKAKSMAHLYDEKAPKDKK